MNDILKIKNVFCSLLNHWLFNTELLNKQKWVGFIQSLHPKVVFTQFIKLKPSKPYYSLGYVLIQPLGLMGLPHKKPSRCGRLQFPLFAANVQILNKELME